MQIGGINVKSASDTKATRASIVLWGHSGCGKTTLACTAPGKKLIINLDPDGPVSVSHRNDVDIVDLSPLSTDDVLIKLKSDNNPLNLNEALKDGKYSTVILDSATSLAHRGLESAVRQGIGKSARFTPTMETPGLSAYGGRNAILLTCIKGLLRVTGRHNVHCVIISHEDEPKLNDQGEVLYITMQLGGKLVNQVGLSISEVWWMQNDASGETRIAIRPCRQRKPMKTRMFDTSGAKEFVLNYDHNSQEDNPIAQWWDSWVKAEGAKIPLPSKLQKPSIAPKAKPRGSAAPLARVK